MSEDADLPTVAATGNRVATLRTLRDRLAKEIEQCESTRDLAALSRQFTLVLAEIDELAPTVKVEGNPLDELSNRRIARSAGAPRKARPAIQGK